MEEAIAQYSKVLLKMCGYTDENIKEIEKEYAENNTSKEIPSEIQNANYIITYPDETTETIKGSELNGFRRTYKITSNGTYAIKIAGIEEEKFSIAGI